MYKHKPGKAPNWSVGNLQITRGVKCTKELYHFTLKNLDEKLRVFIDEEVIADNYYLIIRKKQVVGGFATTKRGYFTGVFALEKGLGTDSYNLRMKIARQDIDESVKQYRIFCTGDFLLEFYKKQGFEVIDIVKWDDDFSPKGWDYEAHGWPNLYNLERERRY